MKISRKKLRKIINEFLDTSRPIVDQPIPDLSDLTTTSVYNQLTNSERAAFISAMGIAGDAGIPGTSQELNEGEVIQFPRRRPQEEEDLDGDITPGDLEIINREKYSSQSVDLDDLDAMFDMYLDNLEKKRSEEDMGITPIKGSVRPHFYDRD